ncbi:hypothetical protein AAXB25_04400 [Paenibacillus lautus]|uniref:hypothetical protein n=1 Tax=Paenibacillus lautus TaxID=1401 RepID=UPI003D29FDA7
MIIRILVIVGMLVMLLIGCTSGPAPDKVFYLIYIQKPVKEKSEELIRTYYIEGEVIGDSEIKAKEELIKLANAWKVE